MPILVELILYSANIQFSGVIVHVQLIGDMILFSLTTMGIPRGLGLKIKAQRLFPSDKFMGVFSGSRQVNALRGVCGSDGVKRVVCRLRGSFLGVL